LVDDDVNKMVDVVKRTELHKRGFNGFENWRVVEAAEQVVNGRNVIVRVQGNDESWCLEIFDSFETYHLESIAKCESWLDMIVNWVAHADPDQMVFAIERYDNKTAVEIIRRITIPFMILRDVDETTSAQEINRAYQNICKTFQDVEHLKMSSLEHAELMVQLLEDKVKICQFPTKDSRAFRVDSHCYLHVLDVGLLPLHSQIFFDGQGVIVKFE
jgi:hypothetical protein